MSFQNSACDVHLSTQPGATSLIAICNNDEGTGLETELLLDDYLGNEDDGPKHIPTLHCDLAGPDGKYVSREIDLADHIANIDGELVVLPY
ncbi:uncharacterized protein N7469_008719 [Penicillium citrinum]|uniref:Cyanovirin-N domain-containing protein n=2 Tax=Penicillium TaxID=5073 RepID=A0A9W9NM54_PENCI|nr:uncharacterized protein N7469_008719 [Penicillium citrinum]KAJ5222479.1 hypothetical protein N7469_008719 [Penicillium citrinum]KAJ5580636.1 hypothetical protein N7450_006937 [Penicillium hetheringtonii]